MSAGVERPAAAGTNHYPIGVRDELMSLTLRLVGEYPEVPAGSVMRCVARAVRRALRSSTPPGQIPTLAEHDARNALAGRFTSPGEPEPPTADARELPREPRRAG